MLKKTYINPNDIIRTKDGKIDLFETIMARKDPTAQIPIVPTSSAQTSTSSIPTETTSRPLKRTTLYSPISTSDAWKVTRVSSEQVASTKTDSLASRPNDYTIPCASINTPTTNTTPSSGAPVIAQTSPQGKASWSNAFDDYCSDPNSIPADLRQWHDNNYLVIKDAYPKAKVHLLAIPRIRVDKVTDLTGEAGIKIVEGLMQIATAQLEILKEKNPYLEFKTGFHIIPSMRRLHLHIISQDFCSPCLKKIAHWNSFNTGFFIPPEKVIRTIREKGSFAKTPQELNEYSKMKKAPIVCNQCPQILKSMPKLIHHLNQHYIQKVKTLANK